MQARLWVRECTEKHQTCSRPEPSFSPTRILDLGQGDEDHIIIRTDKTGGTTRTNAKYTTLSYCWGGDSNFTTTTENITQHETDGIRISKLPQTVQDAIVCTRKLGLRYLWVDALCIIQDSTLDKREQIPQIRSIFHYATCTIVASSARTVYDSYLHIRLPLEHSGPLPYFTPSGKTGTFQLAQTQFYEYSEEPVNTRAWTLEEALLSPRLLIYSSRTLLWQCQAGNDIACHGAGTHIIFGPLDAHYRLPNPIFMADTSGSGLQMTVDNRFVIDLAPSHNNLAQWREPKQAIKKAKLAWAGCLRRYTSRELTRKHDKLQAISGLAEQYSLFFSRFLPEKREQLYVAGLWKHDMPHAMCWKNSSNMPLVPRPTEYRAPSWSWASIDGMIHSVTVEEADETFEFEILDIRLALLTPNYSFGRLRQGCEIRARGLLEELTWDLESRFVLPEGKNVLPDGDTDPEIYLDAAEAIECRIFCVPIYRHYNGRYEINGKAGELPTAGWRYNGLVLARVATWANCFRRVGAFQRVNHTRFSSLWNDTISLDFTII